MHSKHCKIIKIKDGVNTEDVVHVARSRSVFVPANRARRQNVFHMLNI